MVSIVLTSLLLGATAQAQSAPIDFKIDLKEGQKLTYTAGLEPYKGFGEVRGPMVLTCDKVDEKGFTISWPEFKLDPNGQVIPAGSCVLTPKGHTKITRENGAIALFLVQMMLPEKPVAVGGTYKVSVKFGNTSLDLDGTLVSFDGTQAQFSFTGTMGTSDGGHLDVTEKSVFDVKKSVFLNSELVVSKQIGQRFFFKLSKFGG